MYHQPEYYAVMVTEPTGCYAELAVSSPVMAATIASRLLIAPTHGRMARLNDLENNSGYWYFG